MPQRKRVHVRCYGALAAGNRATTPWEDVWLRWKGRPGRRFTDNPTLVCRAELIAGIKQTRDGVDPMEPAERVSKMRYHETLLAQLSRMPHAIDDIVPPNIYTAAGRLDRAEAERMLSFYLEQRYGIRNPKFVWEKTDASLTAVGFGSYPHQPA